MGLEVKMVSRHPQSLRRGRAELFHMFHTEECMVPKTMKVKSKEPAGWHEAEAQHEVGQTAKVPQWRGRG